MKTIVLLLTVICAMGLFAQEEFDKTEPISRPVHAVGFHAGFTTGTGFSYRYWPGKFGVQITGLPILNSAQNRNTIFMGISGLYKFIESRRIDLFAYLGNSYTHRTHTQSRYNLGVGAGMLLHNWLDKMYFSFQTGYAVMHINNSPFSTITGEIGVYFRF